jgi:hypothetical protein
LFYTGRLFQQYIVDTFAACKTTKLDWLCCNQKKICADLYSSLTDYLLQADVDFSNLGQYVILLSGYIRSNRFIQQLYQDSIAIVQHFGKPTFFITITANLY